mgnify:CR=1 FL=1
MGGGSCRTRANDCEEGDIMVGASLPLKSGRREIQK